MRFRFLDHMPYQLEWWYLQTCHYGLYQNQLADLPLPGHEVDDGDEMFWPYRNVKVCTIALGPTSDPVVKFVCEREFRDPTVHRGTEAKASGKRATVSGKGVDVKHRKKKAGKEKHRKKREPKAGPSGIRKGKQTTPEAPIVITDSPEKATEGPGRQRDLLVPDLAGPSTTPSDNAEYQPLPIQWTSSPVSVPSSSDDENLPAARK